MKLIKRFFHKSFNKLNKISSTEEDILKLYRKLIYHKNSKCLVDILENKRYIENKEKHILIILFPNQIIMIQGKQINPFQSISVNCYEIMRDIFDTKLSKERIELEKTYVDDTKSFFGSSK